MIAALLFAVAMDCPMHAQHMNAQHAAEVDSRHDTFGMAHDSSHHNFRLFKDGGAIELRANDPNDAAMIDVIRRHLRDVGASFVKGDFSTPMFVHGHAPDGVGEMKRLRRRIEYRYEDVDAGGRIRITTTDARALTAIHDFMKFQITEHRSADTSQVEENFHHER